MGKKNSCLFVLKVIFSCFILFSTESCSVFESFSKTEHITIYLPAWPPAEVPEAQYPALSGWQISLFSSENTEYFFLPAETQYFERDVRKSDILAVSAKPVTLSGDGTFETLFFMPAGSSYPLLCHEEKIFLTWEDGYASELMKSVYLNCEKDGFSKEKARDFLLHFNWKKFSNVIHEKTEKENIFYNPWHLDFQKTTSTLVSGNFSAIKLNIIPGKEILFPENSSYVPLSQYIPENQKIFQKESLPVYTGTENLFFLEKDLLLKAFTEDGKKVSDTTVFMPKKTIETVYAKKN